MPPNFSPAYFSPWDSGGGHGGAWPLATLKKARMRWTLALVDQITLAPVAGLADALEILELGLPSGTDRLDVVNL